MRIGVSLRSGYPGVEARAGARWMIERARAARDAGLDALFVGDHHLTGPTAYYQNTAILGRLLAEWDQRPAGCLFLLPLWDPVLVAEQIGTLASITRGRFIMQCAIGGGEQQFAGMGADIGRRPSAFEHGLGVVRALLAGGEVSSSGRIAPLPPEPVEVWIGGHAPPAIDRAARLGDGWLAGPEPTPAEARALLDRYRDACARHAREPAAIAIRRDIHVGTDAADAERVAGPVLARGYRGFDPAATIVGGPGEVADAIRALGDMGYTDVIIRHLADEQEEVLASFERLREVRAAVVP